MIRITPDAVVLQFYGKLEPEPEMFYDYWRKKILLRYVNAHDILSLKLLNLSKVFYLGGAGLTHPLDLVMVSVKILWRRLEIEKEYFRVARNYTKTPYSFLSPVNKNHYIKKCPMDHYHRTCSLEQYIYLQSLKRRSANASLYDCRTSSLNCVDHILHSFI